MSVPVLSERGARNIYGTPETPGRYASELASFSDEEESLKSILSVIRKRKYWIIAFPLGGAAFAILACVLLTRQYQGTATIQVGKDETVEVSLRSDSGSPALSESDVKTDIATHMSVLQDDNTALAVIDDLNLDRYRPFAFRPTLLGWLSGSNVRIKAEQNLPLTQATARRERLLELFEKNLKVKNTPDTRLIAVSFLNPDPQLAATIANAVVREYVKFESRTQATGEASQWLIGQLDDLKTKMDYAQQQLADYERETGLNNLLLKSMGQAGAAGAITHIPVLDKLDTLNQELTSAEANRVTKEAIFHLTRTQDSNVVAGLASSALPGIATSAAVTQGNGLDLLQTLRQQQAALKLALSEAATKYGAKNPRIVELQNQLSDIDEQISDELQQINLRARNDYMLARRSEDGLRRAFNQQQTAAGKLNESAVKLQILAQQAASSRQLYEALYGQLQEANVQAGLRATNIRITDPARPPATPQRPNPPVYVAIGLAAGLLVGVSSAFIREHMDETVKTPLQVDPLTLLPVLASIPRTRSPILLSAADAFLRETYESSLLITRPKSSTAEAYRVLRTAIVLASSRHPLRTLLVASPLVGEGKTSVSYNTAIAFAYAGKSVLLVDADMHHPRLHECFGSGQAPGLSDVLIGGQSLEASIQPHTTVRNLSLLPAGAIPPMPAELLGSAKFDELMHVLKQKYSLIILDSPPMLLVTDAIVLSSKIDATLSVVRADVTNRTVLERSVEILERNSYHAVGLVLNGVDTRSIDYYRAYGHHGGGKYYEEN
jgi:succinoglycan biosynthesis transport protein ExoP